MSGPGRCGRAHWRERASRLRRLGGIGLIGRTAGYVSPAPAPQTQQWNPAPPVCGAGARLLSQGRPLPRQRSGLRGSLSNIGTVFTHAGDRVRVFAVREVRLEGRAAGGPGRPGPPVHWPGPRGWSRSASRPVRPPVTWWPSRASLSACVPCRVRAGCPSRRRPGWPRRALCAVPAAMVALVRVQSGAHYPSDVATGAVIGLAGARLTRRAQRLILRHRP
ncbi:phosphatase PAP2 family protein [Streptomyces filipinensis]